MFISADEQRKNSYLADTDKQSKFDYDQRLERLLKHELDVSATNHKHKKNDWPMAITMSTMFVAVTGIVWAIVYLVGA